jgi:hypothetical protein
MQYMHTFNTSLSPNLRKYAALRAYPYFMQVGLTRPAGWLESIGYRSGRIR